MQSPQEQVGFGPTASVWKKRAAVENAVAFLRRISALLAEGLRRVRSGGGVEAATATALQTTEPCVCVCGKCACVCMCGKCSIADSWSDLASSSAAEQRLCFVCVILKVVMLLSCIIKNQPLCMQRPEPAYGQGADRYALFGIKLRVMRK